MRPSIPPDEPAQVDIQLENGAVLDYERSFRPVNLILLIAAGLMVLIIILAIPDGKPLVTLGLVGVAGGYLLVILLTNCGLKRLIVTDTHIHLQRSRRRTQSWRIAQVVSAMEMFVVDKIGASFRIEIAFDVVIEGAGSTSTPSVSEYAVNTPSRAAT